MITILDYMAKFLIDKVRWDETSHKHPRGFEVSREFSMNSLRLWIIPQEELRNLHLNCTCSWIRNCQIDSEDSKRKTVLWSIENKVCHLICPSQPHLTFSITACLTCFIRCCVLCACCYQCSLIICLWSPRIFIKSGCCISQGWGNMWLK